MDWTDVTGNNTVNLLKSGVEKLTVGLMGLFNVKQETIDKVTQSFLDKQNNISADQAQLDVPFKLFGITFKNIGTAVKTGIIVVVVILGIMAYKKYKRR